MFTVDSDTKWRCKNNSVVGIRQCCDWTIAIRPLLRNAMNTIWSIYQQMNTRMVWYRAFIHGNVVMVFANMGMGIGNWEMGISSQIISITFVYVVHSV